MRALGVIQLIPKQTVAQTMAQPLTLEIARLTKQREQDSCPCSGKTLSLKQNNEHFIMHVRLRTLPVAGQHGMLFVPVFRPGLIYRPRFKSVPGLRRFITHLSLHKREQVSKQRCVGLESCVGQW